MLRRLLNWIAGPQEFTQEAAEGQILPQIVAMIAAMRAQGCRPVEIRLTQEAHDKLFYEMGPPPSFHERIDTSRCKNGTILPWPWQVDGVVVKVVEPINANK